MRRSKKDANLCKKDASTPDLDMALHLLRLEHSNNKQEGNNKEGNNKADYNKEDSNKVDSNKVEFSKEGNNKEGNNKADNNKEDSNKVDSNKEGNNKEDSPLFDWILAKLLISCALPKELETKLLRTLRVGRILPGLEVYPMIQTCT